MSHAKTASERVDKMRQERAALGLNRKEVYVHDDDWPELLKLAKRLERRRAKLLAARERVCKHGIHLENACGACVPPRGTTNWPANVQIDLETTHAKS